MYSSAKEAGQRWGISERRVRTLCREGRIPGAKLEDGKWAIPSSAGKPADARVKEGAEVQDRAYLFLAAMPEDEDARAALSEDELLARECNEYYLSGQLEKATAKVTVLAARTSDTGYRLVARIALSSMFVSLQMPRSAARELSLARLMLLKNKGFDLSRNLLSFYITGKIEESVLFDMPPYCVGLFTYIVLYQSILSALRGDTRLDVSQAELMCSSISHQDCPAPALYSHIVLAMYYGFMATSADLYRRHIDAALDIALPRGWYMPLAEFSYALDWNEIKAIDLSAFDKVRALGNMVTDGYIKVGAFSRMLPRRKDITALDVRAGFMMASGKTNVEIANALDVTLYKAKSLVARVYKLTGTTDRKELRKIAVRHFEKP